MNSKSLCLTVSAFFFAGGAALSAPGCGRSSLGREGGAQDDAMTPLGDGGVQGGGGILQDSGGSQGGGGSQSSGGISGKGGAGVGGVAQGGITGTVCGGGPGQPCCGSNPGACTSTPDASVQPDAPVVGTGGISSTGGRGSTGGIASTGGVVATGGKVGSGGIVGTGGAATGGAATGGSTSSACAAGTPLTGGAQSCNSNASGSYGSLQWSFWENGSAGCITTYSNGAFSASWNNSGDVLARVGLQWDSTKTYDQLGTISADFAETKAGTGGGYSYIGVYGWSVDPCVEYYIIDDSYDTMPVHPPGAVNNVGTYDLDGGTYILYKSVMTGTGIADCSRVSNWTEFCSVWQTARQCGHISISQHFAEWTSKFMTLGKIEEARILVEAGGGTGSIDFTTATVTAQ